MARRKIFSLCFLAAVYLTAVNCEFSVAENIANTLELHHT